METHPNKAQHRSEAATATTQPQPRQVRKAATDDGTDASLRVVADDAVRSANALYRAVNDELQRQTSESPYVALGVAAGIGFVVGGGLASPLGQALLRASFRAFGGTVLQTVLHASAEAVEGHNSTSSK
jgi:ElaB/YqjD/DUF883 family membrane-anchored ribosome-binding protein